MDPATPKSARRELLARVAWLYYEEELTQAEIGERLGLNRVTVNRLLKEARETGIVEIKIHGSLAQALPVVSELCSRYGLRNVYLSQPAGEGEELQQALARAAAGVLEQNLAPGITVGVGIGRTVSYLPETLRPAQPVACRFISLTGGLSVGPAPSSHNFDVLNRLAAVCGGQSIYIPAPSFVSDVATRDALANEPAIRQSLEAARSCQVAIYSLGEADASGLLYQSGLLNAADLAALHASGAAGDALGHFFDCAGREMNLEMNRRSIGLTIAELKRIPTKILVAGGAKKRQALRAAVGHGLCDVLVTDIDSANWLINNAPD